MNHDWKSLAERLVQTAAEQVLPLFGDPSLRVETKDDDSPVTAADKRAEEAMRQLLAREWPKAGIIGEEFGRERDDAEYVWVLDPIDGTKSFISASPLFGIIAALLHHGKPVLGVIHQPVTGETMIGDGASTLLNDKPVLVRACPSLDAATLCVTDPTPSLFEVYQPGWDELVSRVRLYRAWGDCYGLLLLARGGIDLMVEPVQLQPWDMMPLIPVVEGAGGKITNGKGEDPLSGSGLVACHPERHAELVALLNRPGAGSF